MKLASIATALPPRAFTQQECWEIFIQSDAAGRLKERSRGIIRKVLLGDNGIDQRYFCLDDIERLFDLDAESLNRAFQEHAPRLAAQALTSALEQAGLRARDLDALFVCTCTGYLCPGLSSFVGESVGLQPDAFLVDLAGHGCGAAIPVLRSASNHLAAQPGARVAAVAVEICSAAFYLDDDPGVLISACLFGDGAAATIWEGPDAVTRRNDPHGLPPLRASGFDALHHPEFRERLRMENRQGKLRNLLHKSIPKVAADTVEELLARQEDSPAEILTHGGGPDVLDRLEERLPGYRADYARRILRRHGNMSSPSILFALDQRIRNPMTALPESLWLASFGAGYTVNACRLERMD